MSIKIVTDSTCDLPQAMIAKYGITTVPLYINVAQKSYLDGIELSRQEFYERLPDFETPPTTSAPGPEAFRQVYEGLAGQGATEILSIHISASLSATFNIAHAAAQTTRMLPVTAFDSGQLTLGTGLLVLEAARDADGGDSMAAIVGMLEEKAARTHTFAALDTLEFLRRSGRVSQIQFGLGSLLRIKPLLKMHNGVIGMERIRTRRRAIERLLSLVSALGPLEQLAVVHTHVLDKAEALRQQAQHLFPRDKAPMFAEVTPVIGSHIGPGAVGFSCIAAADG